MVVVVKEEEGERKLMSGGSGSGIEGKRWMSVGGGRVLHFAVGET